MLIYKQKMCTGRAAYTRGIQIVEPMRSRAEIFSLLKGKSRQAVDRHVEFMIQDWRNKCVVDVSTAPGATTNYFEAKQNNLPFELSPAFFKPEVLLRYRGDHDKYTVGERIISCRGSWALRGYDINEAGQVHAYICDLRALPYEEQIYWKSFNVKPKGGISARAIENDFKGTWAKNRDPLSEIKSIVERWSKTKYAWYKVRDDKLIDRVYTPRTGSRDEWAGAFKELSKLIVECFDVKSIREELDRRGIEWTKNEGNLALIGRVVPVSGLKSIQRIRSKVDAHVGGTAAESISDDALRQHGSYTAHFEHVCQDVIEEMKRIEQALVGRRGAGRRSGGSTDGSVTEFSS